MSTKKEGSKKDSTYRIILFAIISCLGICIVGMFVSHWYAEKHFPVSEGDNPQALFGDSFGAVNALISALAFAGVIITIYIQQKELRLQRKDLELQRKEFSIQNETLRLQRFENTFFNMLSLQQQIVNDLYFAEKKGGGDKVVKGREVFVYLFVNLHKDDDSGATSMKQKLQNKGLKSYDNSYTPTYFDHYFRHLYTIIKFVDNAEVLSDDKKYEYTSMVRATLSRYELIWLFYNGISSVGKEKFKPLIEKYSLLKNIREDLLALSKENDMIINKTSYTEQFLRNNGYSGTDYEFWITDDDQKDSNKYYISAFYNKNELEKGKTKVKEWNDFFAEYLQ